MKLTRKRTEQRRDPIYAVETVSSVYSEVNLVDGQPIVDLDDFSYEDFVLPSKYKIHNKKIGLGGFSYFLLAHRNDEFQSDTENSINDDDIGNEKLYAVKIFKINHSDRIKREIKMLLIVKDCPNCIQLVDVLKSPQTCNLSLVFDYIKNIPFKHILDHFSDQDVRHYLHQLLLAINYAHSHGIIHRDIKPDNILFDGVNLKLIDWGTADFYLPKKRYSIHVSTQNYKAPELLVDYQYYDYSLDMWGFGVIMASIIFHRSPFFKAHSDSEVLVQIIELLGKNSLINYLNKTGNTFEIDDIISSIKGHDDPKDLTSLINPNFASLVSEEALDLISRCLRIDHTERITSIDTLHHHYFSAL